MAIASSEAEMPTSGTIVAEENTEKKPAWLLHIQDDLYWDDVNGHDSTRALLDILTHLLQAPSDDANAAHEAAEKIASHYLGPYLASHFKLDEGVPTKISLMGFSSSLTRLVLELLGQVTFPSLEHERLTQVLIEVYKLGPSAFGVQDIDPDFTSFDKGLGAETSEYRNDNQVPDSERGDYEKAYQIALSTATAFAKLFQAGALGNRGWYARWQLEKGIRWGGRTEKHPYPASILPFAQEIAAQWILISGDALAADFRNPSREVKHLLTGELWKAWTLGFKKLAAEGDGALNKHAGEAFNKMVELFPELFEDEGKTEADEKTQSEEKAQADEETQADKEKPADEEKPEVDGGKTVVAEEKTEANQAILGSE